ncbi:hypothetical protein BO79DRAFT_276752 [Aspergillus costaricaensis CBS 115574]|uniref:Uncharacterized protein n=1 Tax=Aspergillus costaricaensis CBS 115574 TaxID=1448317 RepID=A0ACD1I0N4_9EURO|nr:hypothetical protein BO79DRAFT_276752 [Aspergillus costaricaensis CBS 115574]RAK83884.1 hypothetical protein BO79DRAFT_276752 [Aspergillus costaricaensis CBS 115574]
MATMRTLPHSEASWNEWAAVCKVSKSSIHDSTLTSGSTIRHEQFLLLQVLWRPPSTAPLNLKVFGLEEWKQKADKLLSTFQSWARYRQSFTTGSILEGTFALAKQYQSEAAGALEENFRSDVAFTPVAHRTRSNVSRLERKMRDAQLQTPTKSAGILPKTPEENENVENSEETETPFRSAGPAEITNTMYPQTKDEQIVNTALVDFLNALTVHFPEASGWTLHRKSFKAEFTNGSYEARTDGYLKGGSGGRARALIEVKPMLREKKRIPICMQEAAQMVAWIKSDPDPTGVLNLPGR